MTARLVVPSALRTASGGLREVEVSGTTLRDVLDDLATRLPVLERRIRDEQGALRPHVLVFVDGVMCRTGNLDVPVHDGSEVHVAPAVSGG